MASSNENSKKFQPEQYLERRDGVNYLPLKWRLAWLRSDQPQAQVSTRLIRYDNGIAIFQARIKMPDGGVATGWGAKAKISEQNDTEFDLAYFAEAENQALERALTVLGYGTEYAFDFDTPIENEGIALNVVSLPSLANPAPEPVVAAPVPGVASVREDLSSSSFAENTNPPEPQDEGPDEPEDEEPTSEPTNIPTNIRSVTSRQPATPLSGSTRAPANITPLPTSIPSRGGLTNTPRPLPAKPAPAPGSVSVGNPAVNERLKGIDDSVLVLAIKQIYHEARNLYNLDEDKVDQRSIRSYGRPAYELNREQADEFLERIKNGPRRTQ